MASIEVMGEPRVIVRPGSAADVAEAVHYAREEALPIAVRSGGHSGLQFGSYDDALVIDLVELNHVTVLGDGLVSVGAGATWGDVATILSASDLAITAGDTRDVGVGGLTLGGGFGWLVRGSGLALDNLFQVEIVTADGEVLKANSSEHSDLFWAVRGGGGNFGIVTEFVFRAQRVPGVVAGAISVNTATSTLTTALRQWRDALREAPEELNSTFAALPGFGEMPPSIQVLVCYGGTDGAAASAAISPLLGMAGAGSHTIHLQSYADLLEDARAAEDGVRIIANNSFIDDFSDDAIDALSDVHQQLAGMMMVRYLRGAYNRVPADSTAFGNRDAEVLVIAAAFVPADAPPAATERIVAVWDSLQAHAHGLYGNFTLESGSAVTERMYSPATLRRLREVKSRYDPRNVFHRNHNIVPL
jgi:FAD/FMN-containing dehydrogenase